MYERLAKLNEQAKLDEEMPRIRLMLIANGRQKSIISRKQVHISKCVDEDGRGESRLREPAVVRAGAGRSASHL